MNFKTKKKERNEEAKKAFQVYRVNDKLRVKDEKEKFSRLAKISKKNCTISKWRRSKVARARKSQESRNFAESSSKADRYSTLRVVILKLSENAARFSRGDEQKCNYFTSNKSRNSKIIFNFRKKIPKMSKKSKFKKSLFKILETKFKSNWMSQK